MADITKAIFSQKLNFKNFRNVKNEFLRVKLGIDCTAETEKIYNNKVYDDFVPYKIDPISVD